MAILSKISKLFQKQEPPQPYYGAGTINDQGSYGLPWSMGVRVNNRKSLFDDLSSMASTYSIVARGLDILASFATFSPDAVAPGIVVRSEKKVLKILEPMFERLYINDNIWTIARNTALYADHFCELVYDDDYDIVNLKQFKQNYRIEKNIDSYGRLLYGNPADAIPKGGIAAFEQYDENLINVIAAWWPFQIVQFSFGNENRNNQYTEPYLASIISLWKRHAAKLDSLALERLTKAFTQRVYKIPIPIYATDEEKNKKIDSFVKNITQDTMTSYDSTQAKFQIGNREKPTNVVTDMYLAKHYTPDGRIVDTEVDTIDNTSVGLRELADVELDMQMIIAALNVPMHYLNVHIGMRSFIDKSSDKAQESFAYTIKNLQLAITRGVRSICDRQLLLKGLDPKTTPYELSLPKVTPASTKDASDIGLTRATTAKAELEMGIPKEIIGVKTLGFTPEETAQWIANSAEMPQTPGPTQAPTQPPIQSPQKKLPVPAPPKSG